MLLTLILGIQENRYIEKEMVKQWKVAEHSLEICNTVVYTLLIIWRVEFIQYFHDQFTSKERYILL
jgi:hypothetical protein